MARDEHDRKSQDVVTLIPALRAFASSFCKDPEDADDLVQETLIKAITNLDRFEEGTRLKSWLFTIMRNTFCTRFRKRKRETVGLEQDVLDLLPAEATQELTSRTVDVRQALMRLPQKQREIIVLVVMLGESYEMAAEISGCAVGTVKSRLNRARQRLFHELGEDDTREAV